MSPEAREAFRVTFWACVLTALIQLSFGGLDAETLGVCPNSVAYGVHALAAVAGATWLWRRQHRVSVAQCSAVFTPLALLYLPAMWLGEIYSLRIGVRRDLLVGHEFLMFGVAALFPGAARSGAQLVLTIATSAFGLWLTARFFFGATPQVGEPWITVVYAAIAVAIQILRSQVKGETRRLERARAEALALARMARVVLIIRDRSNTPVQTLELGIRLLSARCEGRDRALLELLQRSTSRLRELSELLPAVDRTDLSWDSDEADLAHEIDVALATLDENRSNDKAA